MKELPVGADVASIENGVKNKWRWDWLKESEDDDHFEVWLRKVDKPGTCLCVACGKTLNYGSSGKRALYIHARDKAHKSALLCARQNSKLDGASQTITTKSGLGDRVAELRSIVSSFAAEHTLPFSLMPDLVSLSQRLAQDKEALQKVTYSRTSATYTTVYGVAEAIKQEQCEKLKDCFFSLNMDEATNNAGDKVFNVVVQYFDKKQGKIVLEHFGSRVVNRATSANLFEAVDDMMKEKGLDWHQVISCMMDNCNVMRGVRGGVEKLCRDKNPHLLDVSGDTLHVISNACKALFCPIEKLMPFTDIVSSIFYDIEESPKARDILKEIQNLLNFSMPKSVIRPIGSRFLQMQTVADRLHEILDSLLLYYYAFLTVDEQKKHQSEMLEIMKSHNVSEECQARIKVILQQQKRSQTKTSANITRKDQILDALFNPRKKPLFLVILHLYRGILRIFSEYMKKFQSEKPLMHIVHAEMFTVTREFFCQFIDPEHIPNTDVYELAKLDYSDSSLQLGDRQLGVGPYCIGQLKAHRRDKDGNPWLSSFYQALRDGYQGAAKIILKLPLQNDTLIKLSALGPGAQKSKSTMSALMGLADKLPNVIQDDELGVLDVEVRNYTVDAAVTNLDAEETDKDFRLDVSWWSRIFQMQSSGKDKYPQLTKLVQAVLSIFCGPLVESTFNIMDDIITEDRAALKVKHYEGLAVIRSWLKSNSTSATKMTVTHKMKKCVLDSYQTYQDALKGEKEQQFAKKGELLKEAVEIQHGGQLSKSTARTPLPVPSTSKCAPETTDVECESTATQACNPAKQTNDCATASSKKKDVDTNDSDIIIDCAPSTSATCSEDQSLGNPSRKRTADIRSFFNKKSKIE